MSMKNKLLALTEHLQVEQPGAFPGARQAEKLQTDTSLPPPGQPTTSIRFPPVPTGPLPRTAPGQMMQVRSQILAAEGEAGELRKRLKQHEGSVPTRKLDTASIVPSRWANRHPQAFDTPAFARLKQDIESAGGNVQPISVRPVSGAVDKYEIVFGHRRHQACSELGLPVLATIDETATTDLALFSAMDRENRERSDLSAYEQGTMYRRALDELMFPSNRRLAEALGVSHTWVANVLQVADLPKPLVECFRSPLEIQPRHAKLLMTAYDGDRKAVLRRADKHRQQARQLSAGAVVELLLATVKQDMSPGKILGEDDRQLGSWTLDRSGRLVITIESGSVDPSRTEQLLAVIRKELLK